MRCPTRGCSAITCRDSNRNDRAPNLRPCKPLAAGVGRGQCGRRRPQRQARRRRRTLAGRRGQTGKARAAGLEGVWRGLGLPHLAAERRACRRRVASLARPALRQHGCPRAAGGAVEPPGPVAQQPSTTRDQCEHAARSVPELARQPRADRRHRPYQPALWCRTGLQPDRLLQGRGAAFDRLSRSGQPAREPSGDVRDPGPEAVEPQFVDRRVLSPPRQHHQQFDVRAGPRRNQPAQPLVACGQPQVQRGVQSATAGLRRRRHADPSRPEPVGPCEQRHRGVPGVFHRERPLVGRAGAGVCGN